MTVSVILPTYNRSESLVAAIKSVLVQSHEDFELIVVDDGSKEDIESVVKVITDARLRLVRRRVNGGAAAARNAGLLHARGEYICFQDSDDLWLPNKLRRQLALFSSCPSSVGAVIGAKIVYGRDVAGDYGPARIAYAPPPEGRLRPDEDQVGRLLVENRISLQNGMFRRDCLPDLEWFDTNAMANEDWEFAIRLAQHTKIHEDIEPVVLAFISSDSISLNKRREAIGLLRILRKNRDILRPRKRQHSLILINAARYFYALGKLRTAWKFVLAAVKAYPAHVGLIGAIALHKLVARSQRRRGSDLSYRPVSVRPSAPLKDCTTLSRR